MLSVKTNSNLWRGRVREKKTEGKTNYNVTRIACSAISFPVFTIKIVIILEIIIMIIILQVIGF